MTIRELRNDILQEVKDQDQEICIDDVTKLISLWDRHKGIQYKIGELEKENTSKAFVLGWIEEDKKTVEMIREYKANQNGVGKW